MPDATKDSPRIMYDDVLKFPKYIRFEPKNDPDNWNIDQISVITIPETRTYWRPNPQGNIWLGKRSGLFLGLS